MMARPDTVNAIDPRTSARQLCELDIPDFLWSPGGASAGRNSSPEGPAGIGRASRLWSSLPRELADQFRPYADTMARAIVEEIQRVVPEYAQPLEGPLGEVLVHGTEQAILHCLENVGDPTVPQENWMSIYRNIGKLEFGEGRSLDQLQTAYRVGGRVAWRHIAEVGQALGGSADSLCVAAEAIFAYVDEISALSIEGYTAAQAQAAGAMARRRRRLLELILADPPASPQAIASLAAAARWKRPNQVTAVALASGSEQAECPQLTLDSEVLVDLEGPAPCLLTADPDRHLADLRPQLNGWLAAVGPSVKLSDAAVSLRWARRSLALMRRGVIACGPVAYATDHLSTLWLLTDEFLIKELSERSLAPFRDLTPKQRARLGETLLVWLQSRGSAPEIAEKLKVHPQTVRYRMHRLEELFGDRLNNADDRMNMEIALRAQRLMRTD
ncbi:helix-turn-helix domain-containing protein [Amycolatopsis anabasis]|uniref:PucR family transcriptional regulator n=1 Tax=Amycolatopsis anabasis TaxID=1840409 RepID=UPI001FE88E14|nr:PucR family transcriptional regulator [Amycolatopsis anabasis]